MTEHDATTNDTIGTTARTVRFPTLLNEQAQQLADDQDLTFSQVIRRALEFYLDHTGRRQRSERDLLTKIGAIDPDIVDLDAVGWASYCATIRFSLPSFVDTDQHVYDMVDLMRQLAESEGAREAWTELQAVRPLMEDRRSCSPVR